MSINRIYIYIIPFSLLFSNNVLSNSESIKKEFSIYMNNSKDQLNQLTTNDKDKKPLIACTLSALIPGTGHFYMGNYKRGAVYFGIELFSWAYRSHYQDKGDDYVKRYKDFANEHWSFDKWIQDVPVFANPNHPVYNTMTNSNDEFVYPWNNSHGIEFTLDNNIYKTNDGTFEGLYIQHCSNGYQNSVECRADNNDNPLYFSDAIVLKDHHFYEGISKYDMFFAGWDDTHVCLDESDEQIVDDNCSYPFESNVTTIPMTANKLFYQNELRTNANKKYDYAENALTLIFINHAISFFDSFITNVIKNNDLNFNYHTNPIYNYSSELKLKGIDISILW